jgi:hypothetical protein
MRIVYRIFGRKPEEETDVNGEMTLILLLHTTEGCGVAFVNTVMNIRFPWGFLNQFEPIFACKRGICFTQQVTGLCIL